MRGAVFVLNGFALLWSAALVLLLHWPPIALVGAAAFAALVLLWSLLVPDRQPPPEARRRIGRTLALCTAAEGVAIFVAINVLNNLHLEDAVMPAIAIIVGLHFVPLAIGVRIPFYYLTALALVAAGAITLTLPAGQRVLASAAPAAAILWLTAIALVTGIARRTAGP